MHRSRHIPWLLSVLGVLLIVAVGLPSHLLAQLSSAVERGRIQASQEELARVDEVSQVFRLVAKIARGGVVHIEARGNVDFARLEEILEEKKDLASRAHDLQAGDATIPPRLIRELEELEAEEERIKDKLTGGTGSGVVYDDDGHILTNNHVIDGRDEIVVHLSDEREYPAQVVGVDPETDLALLRINTTTLRPLVFGDSDKVEVGDWVLAVGAPFGLAQSVTHGIVSARGRTGINTGTRQIVYQDFIQTDAAINPGNSGGPLLNIRGEVIGINTAIATNGDSYNAGIAFTIPSKMARKIAERLKVSREVARGWLGVRMDEIEKTDRSVFAADRGGVLVLGLLPDSPAARAGVQVEDVVTAINDIPIRSSDQMLAVIADIFPGEKASLDLMRGGRSTRLDVTLARRPTREQPVGRMRYDHELLETRMRTMRASEAELLGFTENDRGALVLQATGDLRRGDLITVCNGRMVKTVASLAEQIRRADNGKLTLTVKDPDGKTRQVRLQR